MNPFPCRCQSPGPATERDMKQTRSRRKPALLAMRSTVKCCSPSQRCNESAPRCFCTTSTAVPSGVSREQPAQQQPLQLRFADADRWVRPDRREPHVLWHVVGHRGADGQSISRSIRSGQFQSRAFTSTAHTWASGDRNANVSAIAPLPHPRSSTSPVAAGAGASRSSSDVPVSRCPWLKIPRSVVIVNATSGNATSTTVVSDATEGRSSK